MNNTLLNLYLLNFALLFTHEIDSAYWKEWDLFGIPGGIQVFLILNFVLLVVALLGLKELLYGKNDGYLFSLLVAAAGVFAFCIHTYFILTGHPEFQLPASLIVLASIMVVSLAQGYVTVRELRAGHRSVQSRAAATSED